MIEKVATASGIEFKVELGEIDDLFGYDEQITIYRIVQECVNNIVKHSQASSARVAIERSEWSLSLIVEDNGCGFAPEAVGKSASGGWAWRGCESASASSADGR
jgi:signal transduction histidine kinase